MQFVLARKVQVSHIDGPGFGREPLSQNAFIFDKWSKKNPMLPALKKMHFIHTSLIHIYAKKMTALNYTN